ncbi:MAG: thiamine pyrophosphate-dependent enzyme [Longimicrobiales bacterium]
MTEVSTATLVETLVRARALEDELAGLRPEGLPGELRGPLPVSPGVQAALAAARSRNPPDVLCLRRASPAAALALGVSPVALAHEAAGTSEAAAAGRSPGGVPGGPGTALISAVDPPGTMIEVMAGVALAFRLRNEPRVAFLVDDADDAASGYWHEGLNLAGVQRVPLVVVIDGGRRHALTAAVPRLSVRAPAYGVRAITVEGDDPRLVLEAIVEASGRARGGDGTQLVEVVPGATGDGVDRLARMEPGLSDRLADFRRRAAVEAREAAEAARAASPPGPEAARRSPWGTGEPVPPSWQPPPEPMETPS